MVTSIYTPTTMSDEFFESILPPEQMQYVDHLRYLSHLVIVRQFIDKRCRERGASILHSQYLQNVIGRQEWKEVKSIAQRHNIVTTNGSYVPGERSCEYRLGADHKGKWHKVDVSDKRLAERIHRRRDKDDAEFWDTARDLGRFRVLRRMMKQRDKLSLDPVSIRQLSLEHEKESRIAHDWEVFFGRSHGEFDLENVIRWRQMAAEKIWVGDWWKTLCPYGRYYWNVSGLWRPLRQYLKYDGQSCQNLDIHTSQPLFFVILMLSGVDNFSSFSPIFSHLSHSHSHFYSLSSLMLETGAYENSLKPTTPYIATTYKNAWGRLKPDVRDFIRQIVHPNSDLYEHLGCLAGHADEPRKIKKDSTFRIFYGKNMSKNDDYQKAMDKFYPSVMRFIRAWKAKYGYASLALNAGQEVQR